MQAQLFGEALSGVSCLMGNAMPGQPFCGDSSHWCLLFPFIHSLGSQNSDILILSFILLAVKTPKQTCPFIKYLVTQWWNSHVKGRIIR